MFKYVRIYSNMLEYVRDWFVTCDQLNLRHDYLYHYNDRFISLKIYLVMVCHNTIKTLSMQYRSMSLRKKHGRLSMKITGMRLSHTYLKNWRQPIKREGKYVHGN